MKTEADGAHPESRNVRLALCIFAIWTVLALLSASSLAAYRLRAGGPVALLPIYMRTFLEWYSCAVFTPLILWLVNRTPYAGPGGIRLAITHIGGVLLFAVGKVAVLLPAAQALNFLPPSVQFRDALIVESFPALLTYSAVAGGGYALSYYRGARERDLRAQQLETSLVHARLDALRTQLQPHFLFNALNALSALIHEDPDAADDMVMRISDILRQLLQNVDRHYVTLEEELNFARKYIEVMQIRMGDRLTVAYDTAPASMHVQVPSLILQPIVENAFKHGVGRITGKGSIVIHSSVRGGMVIIEVTDNGPGLIADTIHGVGLANTCLRLQQVYGCNASFELHGNHGVGVTARLLLPSTW